MTSPETDWAQTSGRPAGCVLAQDVLGRRPEGLVLGRRHFQTERAPANICTAGENE
jgi:hypothetical protein